MRRRRFVCISTDGSKPRLRFGHGPLGVRHSEKALTTKDGKKVTVKPLVVYMIQAIGKATQVAVVRVVATDTFEEILRDTADESTSPLSNYPQVSRFPIKCSRPRTRRRSRSRPSWSTRCVTSCRPSARPTGTWTRRSMISRVCRRACRGDTHARRDTDRHDR